MDQREVCIQVLMHALEQVTQAHVAYNEAVAAAVTEAQERVKVLTATIQVQA